MAVFFVLSGFVISYVAGSKEADWRAYATARAARILPVCVLAVLVTAIADAIGVAHAPAHYAYLQQQLHFYVPTSIAGAASYLSFTNQLWYGHAIFGTDEPLPGRWASRSSDPIWSSVSSSSSARSGRSWF